MPWSPPRPQHRCQPLTTAAVAGDQLLLSWLSSPGIHRPSMRPFALAEARREALMGLMLWPRLLPPASKRQKNCAKLVPTASRTTTCYSKTGAGPGGCPGILGGPAEGRRGGSGPGRHILGSAVEPAGPALNMYAQEEVAAGHDRAAESSHWRPGCSGAGESGSRPPAERLVRCADVGVCRDANVGR